MLQNHSALTLTHICLGICTRQRPILLTQCLESIQDLDLPDYSHLNIVIVDNDDTPSAKGLVEDFQRANPLLADVYYLHEKRPGIACARNAICRHARLHLADWIVMLDDDQRVPHTWLVDMFKAQFDTGADVVKSAVTYHYPDPLPRWAFPKTKPHKWRIDAEMAGTNGVMFSAALVDPRDFNLSFREIYNFSSGEDRDFFKRASLAGAKIVYTPNATAIETMPPSKLSFFAQIGREFCQNWVNIQQDMRFHGAARTAARKSMQVFLLMTYGALLTLFCPASFALSPKKGRKQLLKGAKRMAKAFGLIAGMFSATRPKMYRTIHGY